MAAWSTIIEQIEPSDVASMSVLSIGKAAPTMLRAAHARAIEVSRAWPGPEHVFIAGPEALMTSDIRGLSAHGFAVDHPLPTPRNLATASACEAWLVSRPHEHTLIVLLSGGVSAHLCAPMIGITLEDIVQTTRLLQLHGATIHELNTVRKHLERLKGGQMARCCSAKAIRVLAISDVIGDDPAAIASGPFSPDPTTYQQALDVLTKRGVHDRLPSVVRVLNEGVAGIHPETPKTARAIVTSVDYHIVASNRIVVDAVVLAARDAGLDAFHSTHAVEGEAQQIGRAIAMRVEHEALARAHHAEPAWFCWVMGGEWTVDVGEATGAGGPSQELAVTAAMTWLTAQSAAQAATNVTGITGLAGFVEILAYSTDGLDGPTDAAGAMLEGASLDALRRWDLPAVLESHDVYTALEAAGALIRTGPTGTNVNHVAVMVWGM